MADARGNLALVMSGGGALAAYQVGCLRYIARRHPQIVVPIVTGVSAGAINAVVLAANQGTFTRRVEHLAAAWQEVRAEDVFRVGSWSLLPRALKWGLRLVSGGVRPGPRPRSLVDTEPLREFVARAAGAVDGRLPGIESNLRSGVLDAVAVTASSYRTRQSVTWVQGRDTPIWERAHRISVHAALSIDHVMASAALPLLFPAVRVGDAWYGDGGILLTAPLSPAVHLGADRILAISTRHTSTAHDDAEAYPPPAQVAGALLNALFLDQLDADALRLERINGLIDQLPAERHGGLRRIDLMLLRPSRDLGDLANQYEPRLPAVFRFLTRGLGTNETRNHDMLSLLMFQHDYIEELIRLGYSDAEARSEELDHFFGVVPDGAEHQLRS